MFAIFPLNLLSLNSAYIVFGFYKSLIENSLSFVHYATFLQSRSCFEKTYVLAQVKRKENSLLTEKEKFHSLNFPHPQYVCTVTWPISLACTIAVLPHLAPSWILSLAENLASFTEWLYDLAWIKYLIL